MGSPGDTGGFQGAVIVIGQISGFHRKGFSFLDERESPDKAQAAGFAESMVLMSDMKESFEQ